ncbi:MAG: hypothetical protein RJA22_837 [Verrucomicrobiota bacterium]|jgi:hypothetical protein
MNMKQWTHALAALGLITIPAGLQAEEKMNPVLTALSPTTLSGYINTSVHYNPGTGNASVPSYAFNAGKQDGFNLDVVSLSLEKALDEAQWSAGYRADLIFGPDANAYGTLSSSAGDTGDFAIKQAYISLRAPVGNGLDFKVGTFDTPMGYETFDGYKNPNYTRSYGYTMEPFAHTGVLMSYQFCKWFSASAGIANTFGPSINERANGPKAESYKTYIGAVALTAPEDWGFLSGSTLAGSVINGYNSTTEGGVDQTSYYLGATVNTPLKWLKVGASYDHLATTDENLGDPTAANTSWYGNAAALYTSISINEKLSLHLRGEYAWTDTSLLGSEANLDGGNSEVIAGTATLQYDLWKNVLSRLEFRWDHQAGDNDMTPYGGDLANSGPGGSGGSLRNYYTVALNFIYKF